MYPKNKSIAVTRWHKDVNKKVEELISGGMSPFSAARYAMELVKRERQNAARNDPSYANSIISPIQIKYERR